MFKHGFLELFKKLQSIYNPITNQILNPIKDPIFVSTYQNILRTQQNRLLKIAKKKKKISKEDFEKIEKLILKSIKIAERIDNIDLDSIIAETEWLRLSQEVMPFYNKYCRNQQ